MALLIVYCDQSMLEIRALKLFLALADELHFGRTAEALGISQSVLSTQMLRIEDRIGTRLFERGRRSAVSLTTAGATFLAEARLAVEHVERAERIGQMAGRGAAGPVNIGFVFSAALNGCLVDALTAIRTCLPGLDVRAEPMETPEQIAAIVDGRIDLGFIRPYEAPASGIETRIVHRDTLLVALADDHRSSGCAAITLSDLANETFIFPRFGDDNGFGQTIDRLSRHGGFSPAHTLPTRDFVTAIALVAAGYGVVLAPSTMTRLGIDGVTYRRLADQNEDVQLALAWRRGAVSPLMNAVLGAIGGIAPAQNKSAATTVPRSAP